MNYCLLNTWDDEFIPSSITNSIVNCDSDHHKCLGYIANIGEDNLENDLHVAIADTGIEKNHIHSGCIYSDIDNGRQNPILWLCQ